MLSMIGAGPFLTIPLILQSMQGPQALAGWIAGALVALADGLVWAGLGAALPQSGGGYRYLQYLVPSLVPWQMKAVAASVCLLSAALVYRRIDRVGRWGTFFGALVLV